MRNDVLVASFHSLTANGAGGTGLLAYHVAEALHKRNRLRYLVVYSKGPYQTVFPSKPVSVVSRVILKLINITCQKLRLSGHIKRHWEERWFDWLCRVHIRKGLRHLVTTNGYMPQTLKKAKRLGIKIHYVCGIPNLNLLRDLCLAEQDKHDIRYTDAYTYEKRIRSYNDALSVTDKVLAYSSAMYRSFEHCGLPERVVVAGCLVPRSSVGEYRLKERQNEKLVVGYMAHTVLLKGLQNLIGAWNDAELPDAELIIAGSIEPRLRGLIEELANGNASIRFIGSVADKGAFYRKLSLFIAPSLAEGGPSTVLEAMQYGVPTVLTSTCGYADLIAHRHNGFIISPTVGAIREFLLEVRQVPDLKKIGSNGRDTIREYDFSEFIAKLTDEIG